MLIKYIVYMYKYTMNSNFLGLAINLENSRMFFIFFQLTGFHNFVQFRLVTSFLLAFIYSNTFCTVTHKRRLCNKKRIISDTIFR